MQAGKAGIRQAGRARAAWLRRAIVLAGVALLATVAVASAGGDSAGTGVAAAVTNPPNVLIILTDDQRLDGTMVMMPKTRQWFADQGTTFSNAYIPTPLCCPSRSSIFTGQYSHNTGVKTNRGSAYLDPRATIQHQLHDAGYFNGIFGKYLNDYSEHKNPPYWDRWALFNAGYGSFRTNEQGVLKQITTYSTNYVRDRALNFLSEAETNDSQPWFLYLAPYAPHDPSTPEAQYANASVPPWTPNPGTFEADRTDKPPNVAFARVDQQSVIDDRDNQLRTLISVDNMVDTVFQTLQADGELNNTLAVFMSDNGVYWGEHNLIGKSYPYLDSLRVPLYMRWPGQVAAGVTDNRLVANVDLAPTIVAATGVPAPGEMDGRNLLDQTWTRDHMLAEFVFQGDAPTYQSIITPTSQYIESFRDDDPNSAWFREYYDLTNDPYELNNLLSDNNPANDPPVGALEAQAAHDRICRGSDCP